MREFTNHRAQQILGVWRRLHLETLEFSFMHPEATLAEFEDHLRQRVNALEVELAANEQLAEAAVTTKALSGALADPERQREFRWRDSEPPQSGPERDAWWKQRHAVLDEVKKQGLKEALDWECRSCGAAIGIACHTAGGKRREPHFLRSNDAELPYLHAYGLR